MNLNVSQLSFDDYGWNGFNCVFDAFWQDVNNIELYVKKKKGLRSKLRKNDIPLVLLDFLCCYELLGQYSQQDAVNFGADILHYCKELKNIQDSATKQLCENFLAQLLQLEKLEAAKLEIPPPTKVMSFRPIDLKRFLQKEKEATVMNLEKDINNELNALGYFLIFSQLHNCLMWCYSE